MERDWKKQNLYGKWNSISPSYPTSLTFTKRKMTDPDGDAHAYEANPAAYPPGQYEIGIEGFGSLWTGRYLLHFETVGEEEIPVLSLMGEELDGRGTIVFEEFVKADDRSKVPDDYRSALYHQYNDRKPIPTYKKVP